MPQNYTKIRPEIIIEDTQRWLENAVIDLNLCPFAKSVHVKGQIHYVVSHATSQAALAEDLQRELLALAAADAEQRDTTLLMVPLMLENFLDFNDFLDIADALLDELDLVGTLQVASFHPEFQFGDADSDDIAHHTNRSPWPTLHLLREASIDRAVEAFPEAETIYERNIATLRALGADGWQRLDVAARCPFSGERVSQKP